MVQTTDIEGALRHLHIKYRRKGLSDRVLYFCDDPEHITFNLECAKDGSVHLWRFLLTDIPDGFAGERIEKVCDHGAAGLEITDDNILNFYIREKVSPQGHSKFLQDIISSFLCESIRIQQRFCYLVRT